jgi:phosphoribosylamine-glycine ligase
VLASKGYPGNYQKGDEIKIINNPLLFYSGVKSINNKLITNGGRVLSVVALGKTIKETYKKVYHNVRQVNFDGMYYRKDIGLI